MTERIGTPRQQEVLKLIQDYIEEHKMPPTHVEVAGLMGVTKPAAVRIIRRMKDRGLLDQSRAQAPRTGTVPTGAQQGPQDPDKAISILKRLTEALDGRQLTDEAIEAFGDSLDFLGVP